MSEPVSAPISGPVLDSLIFSANAPVLYELQLSYARSSIFTKDVIQPVILGPNITGIFTTHNHYPYLTGPFSSAGTNGVGLGYAETIPVLKIKMDANKGSAIYGKGETVQPSSLIFNYVIKY